MKPTYRRHTRFHAVHPITWGAVLAALVQVVAAESAEAAGATDNTQIKRGQYIVATSACMDCHTPFKLGPKGPEPDMERMLSGHPQETKLPPPPTLPEGPWIMMTSATNTAWSGPWGVSFTANLTPDPETGLGRWSERDFIATIRTGRHMGRGREILPPMPIAVYNNLTDDDLKAVFAYLKTIPAIKNKVPEPMAPPAQK